MTPQQCIGGVITGHFAPPPPPCPPLPAPPCTSGGEGLAKRYLYFYLNENKTVSLNCKGIHKKSILSPFWFVLLTKVNLSISSSLYSTQPVTMHTENVRYCEISCILTASERGCPPIRPRNVVSRDLRGRGIELWTLELILRPLKLMILSSAGDPDPDPQDPHVFEPPGSGSIKVRGTDPDPQLRIRLRILPFSHKCVERTKIMFAK